MFNIIQFTKSTECVIDQRQRSGALDGIENFRRTSSMSASNYKTIEVTIESLSLLERTFKRPQ